jgi:hypothetical protein
VRYLKGSISLRDPDRDLLHFVADARYITHTQLFQLAHLKVSLACQLSGPISR